MRSFGLVVVLVLVGCTKPEPQPVGAVVRPLTLPEPQAAPEPVAHPVSTELTAGAAATQREINLVGNATPSDDPTARIANCKLPEDVQQPIATLKSDLDAARLKYSDAHPTIIAMKKRLNFLVQQALDQCVEQIQVDSPGHI